MRGLRVLLLVVVLATAGCLASEDAAPAVNGSAANATETTSSSASASANNASEPNSTTNGTTVDPGWPSVEDATIRPGVPLANASCTAGFVLASPDNATLYVATAGHCVDDLDVGANVWVAGEPAAEVAFKVHDPETLAADFALLAVDPAYRDTVHPSVRHWGGPTGTTEASAHAKALTFGVSSKRNPQGLQQGDAFDPREGYVESTEGPSTTVAFLPPGLPGDSGSPVLAGSGDAIGVLVTGGIFPTCPSLCSVVADLEPKIEAAADAGVPVEVPSWPLAEDGTLPDPAEP